jgi:hypothetical protein
MAQSSPLNTEMSIYSGAFVTGRVDIIDRRSFHKRFIAPGVKILVCAILFAFANCAGSMMGGHHCRTVHVKVLVDPDLATQPSWKTAVADLFDKTSQTMQLWANVALRIDTIGLWDMESSPSYKDLLRGDCLMKEQPKGKHDILVYFGTMGSSPSMIEAMTLYELGYAFLLQPAPFDAKAVDQKTFHGLVHWVAHMFGAVHCYFDKNNITIMNPFIHDGTSLDIGDEGIGFEPKFHTGNSQIMTALSRRPFDERSWDAKRWPPIQQVYEQVKNKYNPWRIDESGQVTDYQSDAFHEGNLFSYMSAWASLCGLPDKALGYLDSAARLAKAMRKTCIKEGVAGATRLCSICGYDTTSITNWFQVRMFHIELRRTMIYLRDGVAHNADSCFADAIAKIPSQLATVKDKYVNGYAFYRERYIGKADTTSTSKPAK